MPNSPRSSAATSLRSCKNLHAQPSVAHALVEGRLTVHGWYYDILTGRIERYDEQSAEIPAA